MRRSRNVLSASDRRAAVALLARQWAESLALTLGCRVRAPALVEIDARRCIEVDLLDSADAVVRLRADPGALDWTAARVQVVWGHEHIPGGWCHQAQALIHRLHGAQELQQRLRSTGRAA